VKHYYHTNLAIEFSRDLFYVRGRKKVRGVKLHALKGVASR